MNKIVEYLKCKLGFHRWTIHINISGHKGCLGCGKLKEIEQ